MAPCSSTTLWGGGRRPEKTRIIGGKESYLFLGENPELTWLM